jgi:putative ABC transport system permease protein
MIHSTRPPSRSASAGETPPSRSASAGKTPPKWADRLLELYCAPDLLEDLQGDMHERFYNRLQRRGILVARLYFILDVFSFFRPYILRRKKSNDGMHRYRQLFPHYLKTAFRNVKRDKQYLAVNILGLALGIGCSLVLMAYVYSELSFDRQVSDSERVYRMSCSTLIDAKQTDFAPVPPAIGPAVMAISPEIENMARMVIWAYNSGNAAISYEDRSFYESNVFIADSTIFNVLDYKFLEGDANAFRGRDRLVLSRSLAEKIFGSQLHDKNILGSVIKVDNQEFSVAGIIEDAPYTSHVRPTAFISWRGHGNDDIWNDSHAYTYLRLASGSDPQRFQEKLNAFVNENENLRRVADEFGARVTLYIEPLRDIHLKSNKMYELSAGGNISYIYAFVVIAIFFLLSSGINYTNLAIASSAHRYKEIGVRKVMGALRNQIQKQFVTESALMTCIAAGIGLLIFYLLIPHFNGIMEYKLDIYLLLDPHFVGIALGSIILLSILSGFYPAFYLSLINPVAILKNQTGTGPRKIHFRKVLLMVQFGISTVMIAAVLVVTAQMNYLNKKELGFNKENVLIISIPGVKMKSLPGLKESLLSLNGVHGAAACNYIPGISSMIDEHYVERADGEMKSSTVARLHFDEDYLKLLKLDIQQGRDFDPSMQSDYRNAFLVNDAAVKAYGWDKTPEGAMGRKINGFNYGKEGVVVGVVKDVNLFSLRGSVEPLIMNLSDYAPFLYVRIDGRNTSATVAEVETIYRKIFEDHPFQYQFLDERFERLYDAERRMSSALISGAEVLIFISCIGLFGLSAFMVLQRTKEIGIRKVLGASIREITMLLSRDYVKLIVVANGIALPVAWIFIDQWLDGYAYRVDFSGWLLIVPVLTTLVLAFLSISIQVLKASRANPVNALKCE